MNDHDIDMQNKKNESETEFRVRTARVILRECVRDTDRFFSYLIPDDMELYRGSYVEVPFGFRKKPVQAVVYDVSDGLPQGIPAGKLKYISGLIDRLPVMTEEQLQMIEPICRRYLCTMGDAVSLMVPSIVGRAARASAYFVEITNREQAAADIFEGKIKSVNQINILECLQKLGECEKKKLLAITGGTVNHLNALRTKGYINIKKKLIDDAAEVGKNAEVAKNAADDADTGSGYFREVHELNEEQDRAYRAIKESIFSENKPEVFLLHGITGSGKTEVYLKCAGDVLRSGGSVIYMVPEISLTPQTVGWISNRFGDLAAVLHSRLSDKQRFLEWDRIRRKEARIIVGPRSCIFVPAADVRLIIIDEEHDSSYKSEMFPKYNAREIATIRARMNNATLVLGSATPSVTTYYAARQGYYKLLELTKRAGPEARLPEVLLVDMKQQIVSGAGEVLSIPLRNAIAAAIADDKQTLLFLNRRGYSRTLVCTVCAEPCVCPNCSVGMTLHNNPRNGVRLMICHYCGYAIPVSEASCSFCQSTHFRRAGIGTQQLEEQLGKLYPNINTLRMDQDSTMMPGSHEDILARFRSKEASILIGTQMIAKGHDFPDVTVVGIIGADVLSVSSDYKSSERAFQLITQAAGRAGRGESAGTVYLQCMNPDNALIRYAARQDYKSFYEAELEYRRAMNLPPFKAIGEMILSLPTEELLTERSAVLEKYLRDFLRILDDKYGFELFGPVEAPIFELRGRFRYQFIIKAVNKSALNMVFRQIMKDFDPEYYPISFDTDASGAS